ncbi:MAG TPA: beta-aspartyl-peptidase, partial [Clostridiales bacterium]|nr:beta-aspartyl-peptidase [Clostridiales bacterium]
MIKIIKNIKVYAPEYMGVQDVLLVNDKIAYIGNDIRAEFSAPVEVVEIDGSGKILVPGFIDSHVHLLGGGGEGGFATRTPESTLTGFTTAGVT